MSDIVTKMRRSVSIGRVTFSGALFSGVALLLFVITARLTDGDIPRTFAEWLCSITGAVIVWPVVVATRLFHVESGIINWPLWLVSGLLWALLIEWILVRRHDHEAS